jgi:hypothetical protein
MQHETARPSGKAYAADETATPSSLKPGGKAFSYK